MPTQQTPFFRDFWRFWLRIPRILEWFAKFSVKSGKCQILYDIYPFYPKWTEEKLPVIPASSALAAFSLEQICREEWLSRNNITTNARAAHHWIPLQLPPLLSAVRTSFLLNLYLFLFYITRTSDHLFFIIRSQ